MGDDADSYELLDSGAGRKLERFGSFVVDRPSPGALWPRRPQAGWDDAHGVYERSSQGGGAWRQPHRLPESWPLRAGALQLLARPTGFGHLGMFPEQRDNWRWIAEQVRRLASAPSPATPVEVLNLFAYTGGSTLAAAAAGARVCHVDAAAGMVAWARENAALSGVAADRVRWLTEDVRKLAARELRRGRRYQGIILDPPSYGRGKQGQVWELESDLGDLLEVCARLLAPGGAFLLLSAHTPGVSPLCLENLLRLAFPRAGAPDAGCYDRAEMVITGGGPPLPSGDQVRWWRDAG